MDSAQEKGLQRVELYVQPCQRQGVMNTGCGDLVLKVMNIFLLFIGIAIFNLSAGSFGEEWLCNSLLPHFNI